jgi:transcriptional regulator with XRE-family HTH domain
MNDSSTFRTAPTPHLRDRIRQARLHARLTKAELARRVGVCVSAAVQWEHPEGTSPNVANLMKIAGIAGVAFEWLATGRGPTRTPEITDGTTASDGTTTAATPFERRLLHLARDLPSHQHEPMIAVIVEWSKAH